MKPITNAQRKWLWLSLGGGLAGTILLRVLLGAGEAAIEPPPAAFVGGATRVVAQAQIVPIDGIIEVHALAEGRVLGVLVQPGDRVEANQLLAEIESEIQSATVEQRIADVNAAEERLRLTQEGVRAEDRSAMIAAWEAAHNDAELARDRWEREKRLRERGFVSEQTVLEAERKHSAAEARAREAQMRAQAGQAGGRPAEVRAAREQVSSASAALHADRVQLARTRIVAPVAGVVMTRNVNPGDIIGASVTSPILFKLVDPLRVEVRMEVEESMAPHVVPGLNVTFALAGGGNVVGHGRLKRVAPQVEKRSVGVDDARVRADSMIRPAWSEFRPTAGNPLPPIHHRLEAWIDLSPLP